MKQTYREKRMAGTHMDQCPVRDNADRRKSAPLAARYTRPDAGAHWVKSAAMARDILRHPESVQAGAGAEALHFENPEHAPVFFLDGVVHHRKRIKTARFLSPKAVSTQHYKVMEEVAESLVKKFRQQGEAKLEDLSFELAVAVVSEILGLTNSDQAGRARRIKRVLFASLGKSREGFSGVKVKLAQAVHGLVFFLRDVRPAIEARKSAPKNDAISFFLEEGYSSKAIIVECLTYGSAGMMTTREFIVMAAWYLFEQADLCRRYLEADEKGQLAILLEIVRLEPVAAMVHRRVNADIRDAEGNTLPAGELYGIDLRAANVDEGMVGECPFAVDPERAARQKDTGRFLSFSDGPHNCPGWQVAMHETRIFLDRLFRVPGLRLVREPDLGWNQGLQGYELKDALVSCDKTVA